MKSIIEKTWEKCYDDKSQICKVWLWCHVCTNFLQLFETNLSWYNRVKLFLLWGQFDFLWSNSAQINLYLWTYHSIILLFRLRHFITLFPLKELRNKILKVKHEKPNLKGNFRCSVNMMLHFEADHLKMPKMPKYHHVMCTKLHIYQNDFRTSKILQKCYAQIAFNIFWDMVNLVCCSKNEYLITCRINLERWYSYFMVSLKMIWTSPLWIAIPIWCSVAAIHTLKFLSKQNV